MTSLVVCHRRLNRFNRYSDIRLDWTSHEHQSNVPGMTGSTCCLSGALHRKATPPIFFGILTGAIIWTLPRTEDRRRRMAGLGQKGRIRRRLRTGVVCFRPSEVRDVILCSSFSEMMEGLPSRGFTLSLLNSW